MAAMQLSSGNSRQQRFLTVIPEPKQKFNSNGCTLGSVSTFMYNDCNNYKIHNK